MIALERQAVGLFVDRSCPRHWIVRDPDGNFWSLPPVDNPWDNREPFFPTDATQLEPIPGHYKSMLGLPY